MPASGKETGCTPPFAKGRRGDLLAKEDGYLMITVALVGVIMAILFTIILPQMHTAQMTRAMKNLNEYRAYEAARRGINVIRLGLKNVDNFQDLMGFRIKEANSTGRIFKVYGDHYNGKNLFLSGSAIQVFYSTGNDGNYTLDGDAIFDPLENVTVITVNEAVGNSAIDDGILCRGRGILWALETLCGAKTTSTNHDEYKTGDGVVRFVSGCKGIDLAGEEDGKVDVMVLVSRNSSYNDTADGDWKNDGWFFHNGTEGVAWTSVDFWPAAMPVLSRFGRTVSGIRYYDFDMKKELTDSNCLTNGDLKLVSRTTSEPKWYLSIGTNGAFRKADGMTQLWDIEKEVSGSKPFGDAWDDNNGDGVQGGVDDVVEIFIVIRSTGITVAPGTTYETDKTSLRLIRDVPGSHLPSPMRQTLEAGIYLTASAGADKRFFFGQAHNLE